MRNAPTLPLRMHPPIYWTSFDQEDVGVLVLVLIEMFKSDVKIWLVPFMSTMLGFMFAFQLLIPGAWTESPFGGWANLFSQPFFMPMWAFAGSFDLAPIQEFVVMEQPTMVLVCGHVNVWPYHVVMRSFVC